ncbi:hypothetical protein HMPREF9946_02586 [Acetobacteraceae bacterium AT-5844]|nr:hypothetical protein HMPREF9946_02586 [Acetobacteraceae bacterium AT-5844]
MSSPDARPYSYWAHQWQGLLHDWKRARKAVEAHASTFRPVPDSAQLEALRRQEDEAWQAMQRFLDDEAAGRH